MKTIVLLILSLFCFAVPAKAQGEPPCPGGSFITYYFKITQDANNEYHLWLIRLWYCPWNDDYSHDVETWTEYPFPDLASVGSPAPVSTALLGMSPPQDPPPPPPRLCDGAVFDHAYYAYVVVNGTLQYCKCFVYKCPDGSTQTLDIPWNG